MNTNLEWNAGETPWVRATLEGSPFGSSGYAQCYFCGDMSAKLSSTDLRSDSGRVEVYCDNGNCDAREVIVVVARDGNHSDRRADVRILDALDRDTHSTEQKPLVARSLQEIADAQDSEEAVVARRQDRGAASYASPAR
ncbi:hypothetical protein NY588_09645 [Curtobacterium flaccumfaciens pv. beticola]|uniref:hypothetical protein n=1 Tax=Curtobacterium flaccumfaciens TaxID=2035 RepID=UPI00349F2A9A|nr:hypothetical protein [Curtobacterium flaccumfaciens pv. basellae]